jgi:hypothetical protein
MRDCVDVVSWEISPDGNVGERRELDPEVEGRGGEVGDIDEAMAIWVNVCL